MTHWLDFRTGCRKKYLWTEEELSLIREGKLVPGRSSRAYAAKRAQLGIFIGPRPERSLPYKPPTRGPGEMPFPGWWKLAHIMRANGYWVCEIARLLKRDRKTVRVALYPKVRAAGIQFMVEKRKNNPRTAEAVEYARKRYATVDLQRVKARRAAREEWRAAGGDPRALEGFYRRFDCL